MDNIDKQLIQLTQSGLPLLTEPYQVLAETLSITEADVIQRLQNMLDSGVIRRISVVPNHYKLGYIYNGMTVWDVEDEKITDLGEQVGQLDFVSHCYHRPRHLPEWPYNLFAMVHSKTESGVQEKIQQIAVVLGRSCRGCDVLFSSRILKKTGLRIGV